MKRNIIIVLCMALLSVYSCSTIPSGVEVVSPFYVEKYVGTWYEVARFDHKFERGLSNVTAHYALNADGTIKVKNRGFSKAKNEWSESVGKAKFVGNSNVGMLKVSFFGPFYGGYNVIALDSAYRYAMVAGPNFDYLWILSREKSIPDQVKDSYLKRAQEMGFNVTELLWVEQAKEY